MKNLKDMQLLNEERTLNKRIALCEAAATLKDSDICALKAEALSSAVDLLSTVESLDIPDEIHTRLLERRLSDDMAKFASAKEPSVWKDVATGLAFAAVPFLECDPPAFNLKDVCACTFFAKMHREFEDAVATFNPEKAADKVKLDSLKIEFDRKMQDRHLIHWGWMLTQ